MIGSIIIGVVGSAAIALGMGYAAWRSIPDDYDREGYPFLEDRPFDSRPEAGYDSAEARARRVAALTAEREVLELQADAGRDQREHRDAQRRRWLDLERIRYRLGRRGRHIDDMVA